MKKTLYIAILILLSTTLVNAQKEFWGVGTDYAHPYGFIYKTDVNGENMQVIHSFDTVASNGGHSPSSPLILVSDGNLYGRTSVNGTIYKYDLDKDSFKVVAPLGNYNTPGVFPKISNKLIEVQPGILLGTGRSFVYGYNIFTDSLYEVLQTPLYYYSNDITHSPHHAPLRNLFKASNGNIYVAINGGVASCSLFDGGISKINPSIGTYTNLYHYCSNSSEPYLYSSNYIEKNGLLYSTASGGTNQGGVIYSFNPVNNTVDILYNLPAATDGSHPTSMIEGSNGLFYGTVSPENNSGANSAFIFSYNPTLNQFKKLYVFSNSRWNEVSFERNGKLYGTTENGVFEYDIANDSFSITSQATTFQSYKLIEICRKPFFKYRGDTTFTLCEGTPFDFDLKCPNATSVVWRKNGTIVSDFTSPQLHFDSITTAQSGTWQAELTNECGQIFSPTIEITVNPAPSGVNIPHIQSDSLISICPSEDTILVGTNVGVWNTGETTSSITVSSPGTYQIVKTNSCGSFYSNKVVVDTIFIPRPVISTSLSNSLICFDDSITISSTIPGVWNTGDTAQSIKVAAYPNDSYYVMCQNQCRIDTSSTFTFQNYMFYPHTGKPKITNNQNSFQICKGDSVLLTSNFNSLDSYNYSYSWIRNENGQNYPANGDFYASNNVSSIYVKKEGIYFLRQSSFCGTFYSDSIYISVSHPITLQNIFPTTYPNKFCEGDTIQVYTYDSGGIWNTGSTADTINVYQDGSYYYTSSNACGIFSSDTLTYDFEENYLSFTPSISSVCIADGDTSFALSGGTPSGGLYSGNAVVSIDTFKTSLADIGSNEVTYSYGTMGHCAFTKTAIITVDSTVPNKPNLYYSIIGDTISHTVQPNEQISLCNNQTLILATDPWVTGIFSNGVSNSVTFINSQGKYYFTAQNGCGTSTSDTLTVHYTSSGLNVTFNLSDSVFCENETSVVLNNVSPSGGAFSGDGINGNQFSPALAGIGTHQITYQVTGSLGCTGSATQNIVVSPQPSINFSINDSEICLNANNVKLNNVSPTGGTFSGNGINGNQFSPSLAGVGTHQIMYQYTDSYGCSNKDTAQIVVLPIPQKPIVTQNGHILTTSSTATSYQWINCNNNISIAGETNHSFKPTENGFYAVQITNSVGCKNISDCFEFSTLGINYNAFIDNVKLYPNPTTETIYIETSLKIKSIKVFNPLGSIVMNVNGNSKKLDLSNLAKGLYTIEIETPNSRIFRKIIKQ